MYGFSGVNNAFNSKQSNSTNTLNTSKADNLLIAVRVKDIILNESHPNFEELGGWNGLGVINYEEIQSPTGNILSQKFTNKAYPLNPNIKAFPLINETVYIFSLPDTSIGNKNTSSKKYYITNIGLWNHPHHNGYPLNSKDLPPSQQKDYIQTQAGSVRRVTDQSTEIFLGNTFKERANIHPLLPFEGDIIYEGRWGNSIRFGSTVKNTPNNWSNSGENGDPLIIIRNGQGKQTNEGWIPIAENINNDNSSIYIASTQNIPLEVASTSYESYPSNKKPTTPNKHNGKQIILNSGRLVFNTNEDHILLSSAKSINLNSKESINIDTPETSIQSNKIYLGKYKAEEPLMLGTQTVNLLKNLVQSLTTFMNIASTATTNICVQGSPATLPTINIAAQTVLTDLNNLSKSLGVDPKLVDCKITSKRNYTV